MILSDKGIRAEMEKGNIVIDPFDEQSLGTNSYDVHLGPYMAMYEQPVLDARQRNTLQEFTIPEEGLRLDPGRLYLGVTQEYTETHNRVPFLEGKSSAGRFGIFIHATAGKGDVGYCNTWTLEVTVAQPVIIYAGMPIGQLIYFEVDGEVETYYHDKKNAKYNERAYRPIESRMYRNNF
jgi:dCTP deaminase